MSIQTEVPRLEIQKTLSEKQAHNKNSVAKESRCRLYRQCNRIVLKCQSNIVCALRHQYHNSYASPAHIASVPQMH